jgi:hypothetical protein
LYLTSKRVAMPFGSDGPQLRSPAIGHFEGDGLWGAIDN